MLPRYTLIEERLKSKHTVYPTIKGSSLFNALVFKPNSQDIKVAPYLCSCDECLLGEYGSCSVFESVTLVTGTLNQISLRSDFHNAPDDDDDEIP